MFYVLYPFVIQSLTLPHTFVKWFLNFILKQYFWCLNDLEIIVLTSVHATQELKRPKISEFQIMKEFTDLTNISDFHELWKETRCLYWTQEWYYVHS
jgi:hypothetical protein